MTKRHSSNDDQRNFTKLDNDYVRNTDKAINRKKNKLVNEKYAVLSFFCDCTSRYYRLSR